MLGLRARVVTTRYTDVCLHDFTVRNIPDHRNQILLSASVFQAMTILALQNVSN
jgi:hypothetical protein